MDETTQPTRDKGKTAKRDRGDGRIYLRGGRYWIEYWYRGKQFRESAGKTEDEARRKLKVRLREILGERFVGPQQERITVQELCDSLMVHLKTKGARSVRLFKAHLKSVRQAFALTRAADLTTASIESFINDRLAAGKARATVNRETGALRMALNLACRTGTMTRAPHVPMMKEAEPRRGFFERHEFDALAALLPEYVADFCRFGYLTGWRKGEIAGLRWADVDRREREIRLGTSKNGYGRVLPLEGELWDLIAKQWGARQFERPEGTASLSDYVFHRDGEPVKEFRKSWATACKKANLPGRLFHDFRRTAIRDMVRAGVPQSVAMTISGHRTVSVFLRYNITNGDDMREALRRTKQYRHARPTKLDQVVLDFPANTDPH